MGSLTARSLAVKRLRVHRLVLTATAGTVLILVGLLAVIVGLGMRAPISALRSSLVATPVAEVVTAPLAADAAAQDAVVRRIIAADFRGVPILVTHRSAGSATWTIAPITSRLTPGNLPALASGYAELKVKGIRPYPSAQFSGSASRTVAALRSALSAADAVIPIPIGVIGLAGVIALALCGQVLASTRDNETRLLRARGARVGALVVTDTIEALVVAAPAAVVGGILVQVALLFWLGAPTGAAELVIPVVVTIALAGIVGAIGSFVAARSAGGAPRHASGRATGLASAGVTILVLVLAGVATWRFLSFGTPTPGTPEDASALVAPAALLGSAALLGLLLLGPVFGVIERAAGRRRSIAVLPPRQVHRGSILYAGVVASVILSVATSTLASGYTTTWTSYLANSGRLTTGSDLRVSFVGSTLDANATSLLSPAAYAKVHGVTAVAPVFREADSIGTENITTIGIAADRIRSIVGPDTSLLSATTLADDLAPVPLAGIALPAHATSVSVHIELTARTTGPEPTASPSLWIEDRDGDIAPVGLGQFAVPPSGQVTRTVSLPSGGPWMIVALDSHLSSVNPVAGFSFSITDLTAVTDGRPTPVPGARDWVAQDAVFTSGAVGPGPSESIGYSMDSAPGGQTDTAVRLMPKGSAIVPVVVSRALADANGLRAGSRVDVDGTWASFEGRVAGVVPLVPGASSGASLAVDLPSVENGWLRTSEQLPALHELWIASSTPAATATRVADVAGRAPHVSLASVAVGRGFIANAVLGLWLGALGSIAFVILALVAAVAVILRRRADEIGVLRGLGLTPQAQARARRAEFVIVTLYAGVVGIVLGVAIALMTVAILARASTPSAPPDLTVVPRFDPLSIVGVLVILIIAIWVILARYGAVVRASAGRAVP